MQKTFLQISCMLSQSFLFDKSQIIENKYNYKLLGLIAYPHKEYNISHVSRLANATPAIFSTSINGFIQMEDFLIRLVLPEI